MIPYNTITAWGVTYPWPTREQVEQDLLLSKAICDIYSNELLSRELIFRGGTALHKLILPQPYRYSEDLDFVRVTSGGIGDIMKELTKLGIESGYKVTTRMGPFPKVYWSTTAQTGLSLRVKIEINTQERSPFLPLATIDHSIHTEWFTGSAAIRVYQNEEIAATKLRALYQRAKGRDLFDLWLLTCEAGADTETTCHAFSAYRPVGYTAQRAIDNLDRKLTDIQFRHDIDNLLATGSITYSVEEAAGIVINSYLQYL